MLNNNVDQVLICGESNPDCVCLIFFNEKTGTYFVNYGTIKFIPSWISQLGYTKSVFDREKTHLCFNPDIYIEGELISSNTDIIKLSQIELHELSRLIGLIDNRTVDALCDIGAALVDIESITDQYLEIFREEMENIVSKNYKQKKIINDNEIVIKSYINEIIQLKEVVNNKNVEIEEITKTLENIYLSRNRIRSSNSDINRLVDMLVSSASTHPYYGSVNVSLDTLNALSGLFVEWKNINEE